VHVRAAGLAPGERARLDVRQGCALPREDQVKPVPPLRGVLVGAAADMRGRHRHVLDDIAEPAHAVDPPVEQLPIGGDLDDVLDDDGPVAVHLGRADDVVEGGAGALVPGLRDRPEQLQFGLATLLPPATRWAQFGADRGDPADVGAREPTHVVVVDVSAQVLRVPEVRAMGLDRPLPVISQAE
jgi:hypothetical protein